MYPSGQLCGIGNLRLQFPTPQIIAEQSTPWNDNHCIAKTNMNDTIKSYFTMMENDWLFNVKDRIMNSWGCKYDWIRF